VNKWDDKVKGGCGRPYRTWEKGGKASVGKGCRVWMGCVHCMKLQPKLKIEDAAWLHCGSGQNLTKSSLERGKT
jgi:hypothetical protein